MSQKNVILNVEEKSTEISRDMRKAVDKALLTYFVTEFREKEEGYV